MYIRSFCKISCNTRCISNEKHGREAFNTSQINKFGFIKIQYKENKTHQTNVQAIKNPTEFVLYMQVLAMETMFYI